MVGTTHAEFGASQLARWATSVRAVLHAAVDCAVDGDRLIPAILARHAREVELWQAAVSRVLTVAQVGKIEDERRAWWLSIAERGECMANAAISDVGDTEPLATRDEAEAVARQLWLE